MGMLGLGRMTAGSLFKRPETVRYPFEERELSAGFRGCVENDVEVCVFCGMCARRCPCGAIEVDRKEGVWRIDRCQCVQCAACVRCCPKDCLSMEAKRPAVVGEKEQATLEERRLAEA